MRIEAPSGQIFHESDIEIFKLMDKCGFICWNDIPFTLISGIESRVYVRGRDDITDHPDFEWVVGCKLAFVVQENSLPDDKQPCLIGIPTAGTSLAQAASMVSYIQRIHVKGLPICHRIMKEVLKKHGDHFNWVNGEPRTNLHTYWTVDNVITDGRSKLEATNRFSASRYQVTKMPHLIFVDRQQGGVKKIEQAGFARIVVVYRLLDLAFAFGELKLWPKNRVRSVEKEIEAHQFT